MSRKLKQSWIHAFELYMSDTESPKEFVTWSAVSAVASSLKKNVWIEYGKYNIYPNQYIILIGPPGIGKGTAINPAVDLVKDAGCANYISDRITAEKIVERLSDGVISTQVITTPAGPVMSTKKDTTATIVSTELPIFLQTSEWMLPLMCDIWDKNEFSYETKTKNSFVAKNICVSLIGGCVPDYIRKLNKDATSAITGGFTSRCIFVYCSDKSRYIAWPAKNVVMSKLYDDLVNDLKEINKLNGEFTFTMDAKKFWEKQYPLITIDPFESEVLMGFKSRMKSHIFKVAMALSAAESDTGVIQMRHLEQATLFVNQIRDKVDITFRAVGESPMAAGQERIRMYIERKGIASRAQILKDNYRHVTDEQLTAMLMILEHAGLIRVETTGGKQMYVDNSKRIKYASKGKVN